LPPLTAIRYTRFMWQRFSRILVILCVVQLVGGHWAALQSVAWVQMVISYSQQETLADALEKTFDGEHPCHLCTIVKQGQAAQDEQEMVKNITQLEAVLVPALILPAPHPAVYDYCVVPLRHPLRGNAPGLRPPIS
jgi:hypothetical protein